MTAPDLASWLLEQTTEDERVAQASAKVESMLLWWYDGGDGWDDTMTDYAETFAPTRLLAECTAKRNIIAEHQRGLHLLQTNTLDQGDEYDYGLLKGQVQALNETLRHLAQPYADRPGYQEVWRP